MTLQTNLQPLWRISEELQELLDTLDVCPDEQRPELEARIAKTIAFVKGFAAARIDGSEERSVLLKMRSGDMTFRGQDYLFKLTLPNFYFHITTAYDILRHNGVELGKRDFMGRR